MARGILTIVPSSVSVTGSGSESAAIRSDGTVDFANAATMRLNGVFSATYDNYIIVVNAISSTSGTSYRFRLGNDATASSYISQYIDSGSGSSASANRVTQTYGIFGEIDDSQTAHTIYLYGPALARTTAFRTISSSGNNDGQFTEYMGVHTTASAWSFFDIITGTFTGSITVFGLVK